LAVAWAGTEVSVGTGEGTVRSVGNGVGDGSIGVAGAQLSSAAVVTPSTHQAAHTRVSMAKLPYARHWRAAAAMRSSAFWRFGIELA
jgi:hypothetical protein